MRLLGDPIVDALISDHARQHGVAELAALMGQLFASERLPAEHALVQVYLEATPVRLREDADVIARGLRLFTQYGPEMLLILGC